MEKFPGDEIFSICTTMLHMLGENEQRLSFKFKCFRTVNCAAMSCILFYVLLNFYQAETEVYIKTLHTLIVLFQGIIKYLALIYNKRDLIRLCEDVASLLRKYENSSVVVHKAILAQNKLMRTIQLSIVILSAVIWVIYISKSVITTDYVFVYESATPKSYPKCALVLMSQYYFSAIQVMAVLVTNFIYLLLCAYLVLLVRALREHIQRIINSDRCFMKEEIYECIADHQKLLSAYSLVNDAFSVVLMFEYYSLVVFNCSVIVEFVLNQNKTVVLQESLTMVFILFHFGFFTVLAEQMASEYSDLEKSLYLSNWYRADLNVRKLMLLMMKRSQNMRYFSAGGLIDINVKALGNVITKIYTVYAFINNLLGNSGVPR